MKKGILLVFVIMLAVFLFSCASGSETKKGAPVVSKEIERVIIDYKGAAVGAEIPQWVTDVANDDYNAIKAMPQFKGKIPLIEYSTGQNLDLLKSWVNNFSVQAAVSKRISNNVEAQFGGEQLGDKNTPENQNFIKEIVATCSRTEINGLEKNLDYWTKVRTIDNRKKTDTEEYSYYVVYSIKEEDLDYQIAKAMGKIEAKSKEQEELKEDVKDAMKRVAFSGIEKN